MGHVRQFSRPRWSPKEPGAGGLVGDLGESPGLALFFLSHLDLSDERSLPARPLHNPSINLLLDGKLLLTQEFKFSS